MNIFVADIELCIGLLLVWFSATFLWKSYRLDLVRHKLFRIREKLFLFMAEGNVPADHPAYAILRLMINATINQAEHVSFLSLMLWSLVDRPDDFEDASVEWQKEAGKLPSETREFLLGIKEEVMHAIAWHVFSGFTGKMLIVLLMPAYVVSALQSKSGLKKKATVDAVTRRKELRRVENVAFRTAERKFAACAA